MKNCSKILQVSKNRKIDTSLRVKRKIDTSLRVKYTHFLVIYKK